MESGPFTIHTDGGSRGNPGPAAYGFILSRPGEDDLEENDFLGEATNNIAEYTAVVRALEKALEMGAERVVLKSDSELMVKQMNGQYKVKNVGLLPLYEEASRLRRKFKEVKFQHVRREFNKDADRLCNDAMDSRGSTTGRRPPAPRKPATVTPIVEASSVASASDLARDEGLEILTQAAQDWAEGTSSPTVEEVWEEILEVLTRHGRMGKT